jgi:hypothetical protein
MPFVALDGCFMAFRHRATHANRDRVIVVVDVEITTVLGVRPI